MDAVLTIERIFAIPALGSHWHEDVSYLHANPTPAGERYRARSSTPGFTFVREPGEALSLGVVHSGGRVSWGEAMSVSYGGKSGRDPIFRAKEGRRVIQELVAPRLEGLQIARFRDTCDDIRSLSLCPALRYGLTQALLSAISFCRKVTPAEIVAEEWGLPVPTDPVPIHGQCGDNRFEGAERLMARRLLSLPQSLVDDIPEQVGNGEKLIEYAGWLRRRSREIGGEDYRPTLHLDVHGAIGVVRKNDSDAMANLISEMEKAAAPLKLRIESPVLAKTLPEQLDALRSLKAALERRGSLVGIVVDEWANTLDDIRTFSQSRTVDMIHIKTPDVGGIDECAEAVLACHAGGVKALLGGSCNETDLSARLTAQLGLAVRPEALLAKPGLGIDEGVMILSNEMGRTLAEISARSRR